MITDPTGILSADPLHTRSMSRGRTPHLLAIASSALRWLYETIGDYIILPHAQTVVLGVV